MALTRKQKEEIQQEVKKDFEKIQSKVFNDVGSALEDITYNLLKEKGFRPKRDSKYLANVYKKLKRQGKMIKIAQAFRNDITQPNGVGWFYYADIIDIANEKKFEEAFEDALVQKFEHEKIIQ